MRARNRLVAMADPIDEMRRLSLLGGKRAAIDQRGDLVLREIPGVGDAANDLPGYRTEQVFELLALRCRHPGFGEAVCRGLVFFAVLEARQDSELVESATEEGGLAAQADEADLTHRLQPDLVERGRDVIGPGSATELAEAVGKGDRKLSLGAKGLDRVPHLLAGCDRKAVATEAGVEALDARIGAGALERVEKAVQRLLLAKGEFRYRALVWTLDKPATEIDAKHHRSRQGRSARHHPPDGGGNADDGEHADDPDRGKKT